MAAPGAALGFPGAASAAFPAVPAALGAGRAPGRAPGSGCERRVLRVRLLRSPRDKPGAAPARLKAAMFARNLLPPGYPSAEDTDTARGDLALCAYGFFLSLLSTPFMH